MDKWPTVGKDHRKSGENWQRHKKTIQTPPVRSRHGRRHRQKLKKLAKQAVQKNDRGPYLTDTSKKGKHPGRGGSQKTKKKKESEYVPHELLPRPRVGDNDWKKKNTHGQG